MWTSARRIRNCTLSATAAHIMAQAIKRLYPQADFAFGPATEGSYYDVDLGDQKLSDEDLANIEEMRKIVKGEFAHQALHPAPRRGREADGRAQGELQDRAHGGSGR